MKKKIGRIEKKNFEMGFGILDCWENGEKENRKNPKNKEYLQYFMFYILQEIEDF